MSNGFDHARSLKLESALRPINPAQILWQLDEADGAYEPCLHSQVELFFRSKGLYMRSEEVSDLQQNLDHACMHRRYLRNTLGERTLEGTCCKPTRGFAGVFGSLACVLVLTETAPEDLQRQHAAFDLLLQHMTASMCEDSASAQRRAAAMAAKVDKELRASSCTYRVDEVG